MEDSGSSPSGVTGEPVDTSGLSFTATYDDGTTGSVIPSSYTPTSFGDTVGTQTVTFSFEGTDITVDVDYDVEAATVTVEGISLTEDTGTQTVGQAVDYSGMTFELSLSTGETDSLSGSDLTEGALLFTSTAIEEGVWTTSGSQSLTITINSESAFWSGMNVEIATPAPSTTASVTVAEE